MLPLVRLLRDGSPAGQQQAACAIAEVGNIPANRDAIAEAGGIDKLVALLTSTVVGTPETAARALANLARDDVVTPDDGGAPPDVEAGSTEEKATSEAVLAKAGTARRLQIAQAGGVKRLIAMMSSVSLSSTITARKMWELVAKVIGASADESGGKGKEAIAEAPQVGSPPRPSLTSPILILPWCPQSSPSVALPHPHPPLTFGASGGGGGDRHAGTGRRHRFRPGVR